MSTTVRLPPRIEQALATYCVDNRVTKSEVIIGLLERHLSVAEADATPAERARQAGFIASIDADAAAASAAPSPLKARVAAAIRAKHGR